MDLTKQDILDLMESFDKSSMSKFHYSNEKESLDFERGTVQLPPLFAEQTGSDPGAPAAGASASAPVNGKVASEKAAQGTEAENDAGREPEAAGQVQLKAPLAGVFYRSSKPDEPPYVKEGQKVKKGDTVGLIEAMKMMNEISAPCSGTVTKVCAGNGSFVQYGAPVMNIKEEA